MILYTDKQAVQLVKAVLLNLRISPPDDQQIEQEILQVPLGWDVAEDRDRSKPVYRLIPED